jgi:magnesium-transporting ATPase (P-type)
MGRKKVRREMMLGLSLALLEPDYLKIFAQNRDIEGWEETAWSWMAWALIIAVIVAFVMLMWKLYKKNTAANLKLKTWSGVRTWKHIALGLPLVLMAALIVWYSSRDFYNIVAVKGLGSGVVLSWVLYVVFMVGVHAVSSSWRNEIR